VDLVGLLVFVLVIGLVFWCVNMLSGAFGIPAPIIVVIHVVLVVVCILYLLQAFGLYSGGPSLRVR
jgi:hypothetical protein